MTEVHTDLTVRQARAHLGTVQMRLAAALKRERAIVYVGSAVILSLLTVILALAMIKCGRGA